MAARVAATGLAARGAATPNSTHSNREITVSSTNTREYHVKHQRTQKEAEVGENRYAYDECQLAALTQGQARLEAALEAARREVRALPELIVHMLDKSMEASGDDCASVHGSEGNGKRVSPMGGAADRSSGSQEIRSIPETLAETPDMNQSTSICSLPIRGLLSGGILEDRHIPARRHSGFWRLEPRRGKPPSIGNRAGHMRDLLRNSSSNNLNSMQGVVKHGYGRTSKGCLPEFPLRPDSLARLCSDVLSMLFLFYDSVMVPFMIAWDKDLEGIFLVSALITLGFWTADLVLGFMTCYTEHDVIVTDLRRIARHYIMTWFLLDFTVVSIDYVGVLLEVFAKKANGSTTLILKSVRMLKVSRMLRIWAMLRTGRFAQLYDAAVRQAHSLGVGAWVQFFLSMFKLVLSILWLNHIGSCLWFGMVYGTSSVSDTGLSWFQHLCDLYGIDDPLNSSLPDAYFYLTGLYWSVTAMFSGASVTLPTNSWETLFSLAFIIFGMLFGSSMISALAAMLIDFQMQRRDENDKLRVLGQFLQQHKVEPLLSVAIQKQIMDRMSVEGRVSERDVFVLGLISTELRKALKTNLYHQNLVQNQVLRICDCVDDQFIRDMCSTAISNEAIGPGKELFLADCYPTDQAYILLWGTMHYSPQEKVGTSGSCTDQPEDVFEGQWICELALWTRWTTLGLIEAASPCELLMVGATSMHEVLSYHTQIGQIVHDYCVTLCQAIEAERPPLDDLHTCIDLDSIIPVMPQESRIMMSIPAFEAMKRMLKSARIEELENEVVEGTCNMRQDNTVGVMRVVQLVALRLVRADGLLCVRIGEWKRGEAIPDITLPGTKMRTGELPGFSIQRLLDQQLAGLRHGIVLGLKEIHEEQKQSLAYGVLTKYRKNVFNGTFGTFDEASFSGFVNQLSWQSEWSSPSRFAVAMPHASGGGVDLDEPQSLEVFSLQTDVQGRGSLYAWMRPDVFDQLSGGSTEGVARGHKLAASWMAQWQSCRDESNISGDPGRFAVAGVESEGRGDFQL